MRNLQSTWRQQHKRCVITGSTLAEFATVEKTKSNSDEANAVAATKKRKRNAAPKTSASAALMSDSSLSEAPGSVSRSRPFVPPITAINLPVGVAHLASVDAGLARLMDTYGSPQSLIISTSSTFETLARSIVSQQLATRAAATIYGRFVSACQCESPEKISPAAVLATPRDQLRASGLSGQKMNYLLDLAAHYADSRLSCEAIRGMTEDDMVKSLTAVKGIGKWTADMFAMFSMGRPDVLPVGDLGVRKGFVAHFGLKKLPDAIQMEELAEGWRPWRSIGSYYMWRLSEEQKPRKKESNPRKRKDSNNKTAAAKTHH